MTDAGSTRSDELSCAACGNVYHCATGHVLNLDPLVVLCGPCAIDHCRWLKGMMSRRSGGVKFYDHAHTSIKPKDDE